MRTIMKSTILWGDNKMKILEDYKKIAHELLFEVDDEKVIKYKDKDGESKEMKAGSAKTMPMDHPAKQAWDKMQDAGDDSGAEKEKGQKIGGSDFDRDSDDSDDDQYDVDSGDYKGSDEKVLKLHKVMTHIQGEDDTYNHTYRRANALEKMTEKEAEDVHNGLKAEAERLENKGTRHFEGQEPNGIGRFDQDDVPEGMYHSGDAYDEYVWPSQKDRENYLSAKYAASKWYTMTHPSEGGSFGQRIDIKWKEGEQEESVKVINGKKYKPVQ